MKGNCHLDLSSTFTVGDQKKNLSPTRKFDLSDNTNISHILKSIIGLDTLSETNLVCHFDICQGTSHANVSYRDGMS